MRSSGLAENAFARAIHQAQAARAIERKHRYVNFLHHFAQQGGGFQRAEPLLAQRFAQRVHFPQNFAEHVFAIRAAGADGKISLTQRGQQV